MKRVFLIMVFVVTIMLFCAFFYRLGVNVGTQAMNLKSNNIVYMQGSFAWDRVVELKRIRSYLLGGCYNEALIEVENRIEMQEYVLSDLVRMGDGSLISHLENEDSEYLEYILKHQKKAGKVWRNSRCRHSDIKSNL